MWTRAIVLISSLKLFRVRPCDSLVPYSSTLFIHVIAKIQGLAPLFAVNKLLTNGVVNNLLTLTNVEGGIGGVLHL